MQVLSLPWLLILYILMALIGLLSLIILGWQIQVFRGKEMKNPDGSADSWHEQKIFFGIATADIFFACPLAIAGIILVFISPRWGFYLLAWVSFWFVWANIMTTATSLRFEQPKLSLSWWVTFPTGIVVGLLYIVWTVVHFDVIFAM